MNNHTALDLLLSHLTGNFSNTAQFASEESGHEDLHPLSIHVNRIITERINNIPSDFEGEFLLEESYYYYRNGITQIKPHLFHFFTDTKGRVCLQVYGLPENMDPAVIRNDNPEWLLDFHNLALSSTFSETMIYTPGGNDSFTGKATVNRGPVRFTLEETIGPDELKVMELLEKDGTPVTPYRTPIIYKRFYTPSKQGR